MDESSNRNLGKSVAVVGTTAALSQLLSILYLVFLARWIGPETYALHVAIFNLCAVSAFFVNWGLDTWLLKKTSDDQLTSTKMLKNVLLLKLGFGVLWGLGLFIFAPLVRPDLYIRKLLILAIMSTLFEALTNSIYTVMLTTDRFKQSSAILLLGRLVRLVTLVGLYFLSGNMLSTIISTRTLIDLLVLVIAGIVFGFMPKDWNPALAALNRTFQDAVPFHASDLINTIFHHIDVTLVTFLSTNLTTISSYSLMISFFNVINTIIMSLMNVVVPSLSKDRTRSDFDHRKSTVSTMIWFFGLGLVAWAAITLFGGDVINFIFGSQYGMAADFISRTAVIVLINSLNIGLTAIIIVHNKQKERVLPQVISLVFKLIVSLLIFPVWQVQGLRWIYILSEIVLSIGYLLVISGVLKEYSEPKRQFIKQGDKLKIALITFNQEGKGTYLRAYFLGKELVKLGHDVTILAGNISGRRVCVRKENGLRIVTFPRIFKRLYLSGWNIDELIYRMLWTKRNDFDLVHAFECRPTTYFPARLLQKKGSAFFSDWADWLGRGGSVEERPNGIRKQVLRIVETQFENKRFRNSNGITTICSTLFDETIKRGYSTEKVLLLPNGMCNPYLQSFPMDVSRAKKGLRQQSLIIGYLGSGFERDIELMYSSFNTLKKKKEDAILLHIGRSNYLTDYDSAIICTGPIRYEDISYYLSACDIFWFPLKKTNANYGRLPFKLSDYLTIGRPIISTDVGDLAEWVRLLCVGLIADDTPESISDLVLDIIQYPEQRRMMSKNSKLASENYELSWKKRALELVNFYYIQMNQTQDLN